MHHDPIEQFNNAVYAAIHVDLPDIEYERADRSVAHANWKANMDTTSLNECLKNAPMMTMRRRPTQRDITVLMFPETWSSTALGFGGVGGQAITTAYTVVVSCGLVSAIYWGGRIGYVLDRSKLTTEGLETYCKGINKRRTIDRQAAKKQYRDALLRSPRPESDWLSDED